jgi:signal transduction histidine kinase
VRRAEDPVLLLTRVALSYEDLAGARGVTLLTELPDHLPTISCDADRLHQALGNLISNAIKFTPPGGTIELSAEADGDGVRIAVADSGPGIPEADVSHIFDRFWTAHRNSRVRGTGMGLAIVRGVVEAHGGIVWVERNSHGGATFILRLPGAS